MHPLDPLVVTTPASEPAYCPRCELRHTRRPDWLCPRCGNPVDTDVPPPRAPTPPPVAPGFPVASRLAGALLVLAAVAFAGPVARELATLAGLAHHARLLVAVVVLAAVGGALLLGSGIARWAAVALAAVTAVILAEGLLRDVAPGLVRDPLPAAVRQALRNVIPDHHPRWMLAGVGFGAGVLLLAVARPRSWRLAAGLLLAAPLLVLRLVAALGR
jgi:hypothetical protein